MTADARQFTAAQREAIVAEWQRIAAEPPPRNPRPYGCLTVIVAIGLFVLLPQTGFRPPPPWGTVLLVVLGLALAGGLFVGVFAGSGVHGRAAARASAALEALADAVPVDDAARLRHAVELIAHAVASDGPTSLATIDIEAARQRLGPKLADVLAVEAVLAEEIGIPRFFGDTGG